ncbi:MAG: type II toxin-antitoxin system prevent-host-death family antitoxin [Aliidongia sp.]
METFTVRDLRERTGELVRNAEAGHLSLISKHGHPLFVAVPLDEHLLGSGVTVTLACRLFAEKALSLGKAARLAGLTPQSFIERLGAMGIPAVDYDATELDSDLALLRS